MIRDLRAAALVYLRDEACLGVRGTPSAADYRRVLEYLVVIGPPQLRPYFVGEAVRRRPWPHRLRRVVVRAVEGIRRRLSMPDDAREVEAQAAEMWAIVAHERRQARASEEVRR